MALRARPRTVLIHSLRADVPRGLCIYCERRLVGLQKFRCRDAKCRRAYYRDYSAQMRKLERDEAESGHGAT